MAFAFSLACCGHAFTLAVFLLVTMLHSFYIHQWFHQSWVIQSFISSKRAEMIRWLICQQDICYLSSKIPLSCFSKNEDVLLFFVLCDSKQTIFEFRTNVWTKRYRLRLLDPRLFLKSRQKNVESWPCSIMSKNSGTGTLNWNLKTHLLTIAFPWTDVFNGCFILSCPAVWILLFQSVILLPLKVFPWWLAFSCFIFCPILLFKFNSILSLSFYHNSFDHLLLC